MLVKAGTGADPKILFDRSDDAYLHFQLHGLKDGEIGMAKIPLSFYNKAAGELSAKAKEEPYSSFLEPPYVSISKIELEE